MPVVASHTAGVTEMGFNLHSVKAHERDPVEEGLEARTRFPKALVYTAWASKIAYAISVSAPR